MPSSSRERGAGAYTQKAAHVPRPWWVCCGMDVRLPALSSRSIAVLLTIVGPVLVLLTGLPVATLLTHARVADLRASRMEQAQALLRPPPVSFVESLRTSFRDMQILSRVVGAASDTSRDNLFVAHSSELWKKADGFIRNIGWCPLVSAAERPAYEATLLNRFNVSMGISERNSAGQLVPAASRSEYLPYSLTAINASEVMAGLGFDILSEAARYAATQRSRSGATFTLLRPSPLPFGLRSFVALGTMPVYRTPYNISSMPFQPWDAFQAPWGSPSTAQNLPFIGILLINLFANRVLSPTSILTGTVGVVEDVTDDAASQACIGNVDAMDIVLRTDVGAIRCDTLNFRVGGNASVFITGFDTGFRNTDGSYMCGNSSLVPCVLSLEQASSYMVASIAEDRHLHARWVVPIGGRILALTVLADPLTVRTGWNDVTSVAIAAYVCVFALAVILGIMGCSWLQYVTGSQRDAAVRERELAAAREGHERTIEYCTHHMRNPVHALRATALNLLEVVREKGLVRDARLILAKADQVSRLLDDMSDLAALTAGNLRLSSEPTELRSLVLTIAQVYAEHAKTNVRYLVDRVVPMTILTDSLRLQQVLGNGLRNACQHAVKGHVSFIVFVDPDRSELVFRISNIGRGIGSRSQQSLMQPFYSLPHTSAPSRMERGQQWCCVPVSSTRHRVLPDAAPRASTSAKVKAPTSQESVTGLATKPKDSLDTVSQVEASSGWITTDERMPENAVRYHQSIGSVDTEDSKDVLAGAASPISSSPEHDAAGAATAVAIAGVCAMTAQRLDDVNPTAQADSSTEPSNSFVLARPDHAVIGVDNTVTRQPLDVTALPNSQRAARGRPRDAAVVSDRQRSSFHGGRDVRSSTQSSHASHDKWEPTSISAVAQHAGLGLPLAFQLTKLLGGELRLWDEPTSSGIQAEGQLSRTVFELRLPLDFIAQQRSRHDSEAATALPSAKDGSSLAVTSRTSASGKPGVTETKPLTGTGVHTSESLPLLPDAGFHITPTIATLPSVAASARRPAVIEDSAVFEGTVGPALRAPGRGYRSLLSESRTSPTHRDVARLATRPGWAVPRSSSIPEHLLAAETVMSSGASLTPHPNATSSIEYTDGMRQQLIDATAQHAGRSDSYVPESGFGDFTLAPPCEDAPAANAGSRFTVRRARHPLTMGPSIAAVNEVTEHSSDDGGEPLRHSEASNSEEAATDHRGLHKQAHAMLRQTVLLSHSDRAGTPTHVAPNMDTTSPVTPTSGPYASGMAAIPRPAAVNTSTSSTTPMDIFGASTHSTHTEDGTPTSRTSQSLRPALGLHVLYADDDGTNLRVMARYLTSLGCTFNMLSDGVYVLDALRLSGQVSIDESSIPTSSRVPDVGRSRLSTAPHSKPYDLILLDIVMPRSDGAEVCSMLRKAHGLTLPIVAVTGNGRNRERLFASGFDHVIDKPFDTSHLSRVVDLLQRAGRMPDATVQGTTDNAATI